MKITVSISNKSFWVQTWRMLGDFARQANNSTTKTAKTNPDGTVTAEIDHEQIPALIAAIEEHNKRYKGLNELTLLINADTEDAIRKASTR